MEISSPRGKRWNKRQKKSHREKKRPESCTVNTTTDTRELYEGGQEEPKEREGTNRQAAKKNPCRDT